MKDQSKFKASPFRFLVVIVLFTILFFVFEDYRLFLKEEQIEEITPELIEMAKEKHQQKVLEKAFAPNPLTEKQRVDEATERQNQEWLWNKELRLNSEERGSTNSIGELKWKNPLDPQENTLPKEKKHKYYW